MVLLPVEVDPLVFFFGLLALWGGGNGLPLGAALGANFVLVGPEKRRFRKLTRCAVGAIRTRARLRTGFFE